MFTSFSLRCSEDNKELFSQQVFETIMHSFCIDYIDYRCVLAAILEEGGAKEVWIWTRTSYQWREHWECDGVFSLTPSDVQQLLVRKEEVPPEQQDRSSSLDQEDPEPPHIKEEQEEVWSSQEGEQLQGLEEADISKFPFTPVPVKSEDDEEKPQSSQLHQTHTEQMETGADGEDCGGPEPARNSDPDQHLQPDADEKLSDSSETENSDENWKETREAQREIKQEEPPESPHIKEEQEEVWSSQEGEQLQGLEEADISKFPFTPVPVKSEDDEEKPQSSQLHQTHTEQMETGADGEDCGGPEPARNSDPDQHLQPDADEKTSDSSDPETEDSDDWEETREAQSGLNCPNNGHKSLTRRSSKQTILPDPMESAEHQLISTKTNSKALVKQRLTAAAEEIFVLFERTIAEYEEELSRSKEENERQRKLLDAVFKPEVRLHRAGLFRFTGPQRKNSARTNSELYGKEPHTGETGEENPPMFSGLSVSIQECLHQEDPEPPHIKEEQEEVWSSQEGEQLQGLEEADISKFPFTPVPVKSEDDEEKPQSSQLHQTHTEQMETGADGEDCGGPEPARNSDPDQHLQPDADEKLSDSSETEDSDDDWKETREAQSGLNCPKNNEFSVSDKRCIIGKKPFSCSECGKAFCYKSSMKDRTINSGKSKGGGVCFMVNNKWCSDVEIISTGCSLDLEHLMIRCRPYYLPREFTSGCHDSSVCSATRRHHNKAMDELFGVIDRTETSRPEAAFIVAGDFNNSANLRKVLPRYHQHISCPTRGENTLDHVYTPYTDMDTYKLLPRSPFRKSDHASVLLLPSYRQKLKRDGPVTRTIQQWSDQSDSALHATASARRSGVCLRTQT
ncbi:hypothetical protein L3Q82_003267 [Scortum barcoo]|uniref:Uncharacterized protein n=1 Tax=Scortum barcoo TaxID=214431 RepID=A0ACB8VS18_9TELE|nr:hypothetical protein L3Q82_003267 [Scortum barcoo]